MEKGQELLRLRIYEVYAWGMPIIITAVAAILDNLPESSTERFLRPRFGENKCWFYGEFFKFPGILWFSICAISEAINIPSPPEFKLPRLCVFLVFYGLLRNIHPHCAITLFPFFSPPNVCPARQQQRRTSENFNEFYEFNVCFVFLS